MPEYSLLTRENGLLNVIKVHFSIAAEDHVTRPTMHAFSYTKTLFTIRASIVPKYTKTYIYKI